MTKKEAADRKRDLAEMAEHAPDQKARDWFKRKSGIQILIQAQAEQIADTTKYMAGKYGIRGDADEQEETTRYDLG